MMGRRIFLVLALSLVAVAGFVSYWAITSTAQTNAVSFGTVRMDIVAIGHCTTVGVVDFSTPPKCTMPEGTTFNLQLQFTTAPADPDGGGSQQNGWEGWSAKFLYSGVTYNATVNPEDEFKNPAILPSRSTLPGVVTYGDVTDFTPPFTESQVKGPMLNLEFECTGDGTITLPPRGIAHPDGTTYIHDENTAVPPPEVELDFNCVPPTDTPTSTPTNTDTPTATPTNTPTPTFTPTPTPLPSTLPDVTVTKTDSPDPVENDSKLTYTIVVNSVGLLPASDVVITDTLDPDLTFVSANVTVGSANCGHLAGVVTCDVKGDLNPGETVEIEISVTTHIPVNDELVSNFVEVEASNEPFANQANNKDIEQTVVLAPRSDMTIDKLAEPSFVDPGDPILYTLIIENIGPRDAQGVKIEDTLPAGVTFKSSTDPECGDPVVGVVTCTFPKVLSGEQKVVEILINAPDDITQDTLLKNSAVVSADNELFAQTGNNQDVANVAVIGPPSDISIVKTGPVGTIYRLDEYSYTLTLTNEGAGDAFDVLITDTLPKHDIDGFPQPVVFLSGKGAVCEEVAANTVECLVPEVLVGEPPVVVELNVRAPTVLEKEFLTNNVSITVDDPLDPTGNNQSSVETAIQPCFDVHKDDGYVTTSDILETAIHFGSNDPNFDVDGDGVVTISDILHVAINFGMTCLE